MNPRLLLDTHVLLRWLPEPQRLSRERVRVPRAGVLRRQPVAISAITLLELALLATPAIGRLQGSAEAIWEQIETNPAMRVLPLTIEIAREVPPLTARLRDPADCVIVATARVHGLRLLTSDQRILDSGFVSTID